MQTGGLGTPSGSLRRKQQIKMPKANAINSKSPVIDPALWKKIEVRKIKLVLVTRLSLHVGDSKGIRISGNLCLWENPEY